MLVKSLQFVLSSIQFGFEYMYTTASYTRVMTVSLHDGFHPLSCLEGRDTYDTFDPLTLMTHLTLHPMDVGSKVP